jgi:tRNA(Ile)-lysidine synthase
MERSGAWLRVGPAFLPALVARPFPVPGAIDLPEVGLRLAARRFERPPHYTPPRESRCVAFDADRLPHQLAVRSRRAGERFSPFGGPVDRRLKTVLIDAGVPRWERPRVPLLEAAGDVVWVAGVRRGQRAPVSKDTARILEVTLEFL